MHHFARSFIIVLLLTNGTFFCAGDTPLIDLSAPAVFRYSCNTNNVQSDFLLRLHSISPDLKIEWEHDYQLGAVIIPRKVLLESERIIRRTRLKNGREDRLPGTILGVSQDIYRQLETGKRVDVRLDRVRGWLEKTGDTHYSLAGLNLPAIAVTDNLGHRYIIQKNPEFPVCLAYETEYYSEKLVEYRRSADIIFRWYK
jgi:hypothetical protein